MPVLKNPKHEKFAQLLAQGEFAVDAYEQAGYRRDDGNAVRLAQKPAIADRVQEMTGVVAAAVIAQTKITVETLVAESEQVRVKAMEHNQLSAANAAIKGKAVLTGQWVERAEIGKPGEFDHLSDDELLTGLRERFAKLERELESDTTRH